jgi:GT2 family glycosyltransferase
LVLDAILERVFQMIPHLIVPVLNRYDLLQRMINSIDYPIQHLLIIDNGAELQSVLVPDLVQQVTILRMPANLGVAPSWNLGVKSFPFDDVFYFSSNDVVYSPGTLERLHKASDRGCVTICEEFPHWQTFSVGDKVFERSGLFDESIFPMNWEDDEFTWRVESLGFDVVKVDLPMSHDAHASFRSDDHYSQRNNETYKSNELYFRDKQERSDLSAGHWSLIRR